MPKGTERKLFLPKLSLSAEILFLPKCQFLLKCFATYRNQIFGWDLKFLAFGWSLATAEPFRNCTHWSVCAAGSRRTFPHFYLPIQNSTLPLRPLSNLVFGGHGRQLSLSGLNEALEDVLDRRALRYRVPVQFVSLLLKCWTVTKG